MQVPPTGNPKNDRGTPISSRVPSCPGSGLTYGYLIPENRGHSPFLSRIQAIPPAEVTVSGQLTTRKPAPLPFPLVSGAGTLAESKADRRLPTPHGPRIHAATLWCRGSSQEIGMSPFPLFSRIIGKKLVSSADHPLRLRQYYFKEAVLKKCPDPGVPELSSVLPFRASWCK